MYVYLGNQSKLSWQQLTTHYKIDHIRQCHTEKTDYGEDMHENESNDTPMHGHKQVFSHAQRNNADFLMKRYRLQMSIPDSSGRSSLEEVGT